MPERTHTLSRAVPDPVPRPESETDKSAVTYSLPDNSHPSLLLRVSRSARRRLLRLSHSAEQMTLTVDTANENVVNTQYAVRGEIVQIAAKLAAEGRKIIYCNIGNPQR